MWRYQAIKDKDGEVGMYEYYELESGVYWTEDAIEVMSEDAEGLKWVLLIVHIYNLHLPYLSNLRTSV